jgi:hypothetical protein
MWTDGGILKAARTNVVHSQRLSPSAARQGDTQHDPEVPIMQIAKIAIGFATFVGATLAQADGFAITQSISNGREMHLLEHAEECNGGPGAFIYRHDRRVDQTCNVRLTPAGATVEMPPFEPRVFVPRDTLYENSKG